MVVARFGDEIVGVAIIKYIHRPESSFRPAEDFCHIEEFKEALMFYESAGFRTYRRDLELEIR